MKRDKPKLSVQPAKGKVRLPPRLGGRFMPEDGMEVPDTVYWRRRLRGGDVVLKQKQLSKKVADYKPIPVEEAVMEPVVKKKTSKKKED